MSSLIPVIDLFAGSGGLGEGFAAFTAGGQRRYEIGLSIEKDVIAHQTLELRSFFRQFEGTEVPEDYYHHVRSPRVHPRAALFDKWPRQSAIARREAWNAELGQVDEGELDSRIREVVSQRDDWVLIGGPPCQAYSLVGINLFAGQSG